MWTDGRHYAIQVTAPTTSNLPPPLQLGQGESQRAPVSFLSPSAFREAICNL